MGQGLVITEQEVFPDTPFQSKRDPPFLSVLRGQPRPDRGPGRGVPRPGQPDVAPQSVRSGRGRGLPGPASYGVVQSSPMGLEIDDSTSVSL